MRRPIIAQINSYTVFYFFVAAERSSSISNPSSSLVAEIMTSYNEISVFPNLLTKEYTWGGKSGVIEAVFNSTHIHHNASLLSPF